MKHQAKRAVDFIGRFEEAVAGEATQHQVNDHARSGDAGAVLTRWATET